MTNERIHEFLIYVPETGELIWKPRSLECFKTQKSMNTWNTRFSNKVAGSIMTNKSGYQYIQISLFGSTLKAHRVSYLLMTGKWPSGDIDHIDGNSLNNKWSNLRIATRSENARNMKRYSRNTSGTTGVSWVESTKQWSVRIWDGTKNLFLGLFKDYEEAVSVRKAAEIEHKYHRNHGR